MIRINLLPHREEKRRMRRQQFYALSGLIALLAGVTWVFGYSVIDRYIKAQEEQNIFLKKEIVSLDKEIDEIKHLKEQTDSLLSRKRIIESLQADRTETVHLFNELARQVPEGVYLKTLKQTGQKISLTGYAQSNSRISTLMRNLEGSPLLERPDLIEIKAVTVNNRRISEFSMNVLIARQNKADAAMPKASPTPGKNRQP